MALEKNFKRKHTLPLSSYIRNPPTILEPEQVIIFQAIRYSLDICDIAYERLLESLITFTENRKISQSDFPYIFLDVWTIINHSVIFKKIICSYLNQDKNDEILTQINKAKKMRDSHQHIDERISEILSIDDLPIYGFLTWTKHYLNSDNVTKNSIYSGTITDKKSVSISMSNKSIDHDHPIISKLEFTGIVNNGNRKNKDFDEETIHLTQLMNDLSTLSNHFDKQVFEQVRKYDIDSVHRSDVCIQLYGKYTDDISSFEKDITK